MDDLRERFDQLDRSLAELDMPDLLRGTETRTPVAAERFGHVRPHRSFLALAAVLVLALAVVGWVYLTSSSRDTAAVQCVIGGDETVIDSITGNPAADCAALFKRETGRPAPELAAYDNGSGGITVIPASEEPPPGWTRLPKDATQNLSMIKMQEWLDDYVSGLNSGCYDNTTATRMTEDALRRLGMTNWTVQPAPAGEVAGLCVDAGILDPTRFTVQLRAFDGPPDPDLPLMRLADRLRSIQDGCWPLVTTARKVRAAADDLELSESATEYQLHEVKEEDAACTTIRENVGGAIVVILRGPAG